MNKSKQTSFPYEMGNAGDLLKHGVLAEILRHRLIFQPDQPIRFLDLFAGEPFSGETSDEIVQRVGDLSECALQNGQPDIHSGRYYGSSMLVRKLGDSLGGRVSVFASDRDAGRQKKLDGSGLRPLENAFSQLGELGNYDAYRALEVIGRETTRKDLILIDPFADFLEPNANGCNRAEDVLPIVSEIAQSSTVVLFVLNMDPFNRVGRRFDELLAEHLSGAFTMTCPPIRTSKIKGEKKYYADVVLAGPDLVGDPSAVANFRCRLELLARKLVGALGLSERGHVMLRPRTIGDAKQIPACEGGQRGTHSAEMTAVQDGEVPSAAPRRALPDLRLPTPGRSVAGVDGCKAGWVMVRRDEKGRFDVPVIIESLDNVPQTDVVVIDIPIGLPDRGRRECDLAARRMLGPRRGTSVFTGARRPLLSMMNRETAHAWGRKRDDLGVNVQLWAILPKIREVDAWITPERNRAIREGHPELSFYAAAGRPMQYNKKEAAGRGERLDALACFIDRAIVLEWLGRARGSGAAKDDILDALALCRSAARVLLDCHGTVPTGHPPQDSRGLSMEMVF